MNKASKASTASSASKAYPLSPKKVLIITYYWPPSGGAGVQRWLKFSKYLPEFGWNPIILTVDPEYAEFPTLDESLNNETKSDIKVYKTKASNYYRLFNRRKKDSSTNLRLSTKEQTSLKAKVVMFIRGNFFIPDPRKGWNKYAFKKALKIIAKDNIKHVLTTSPPHSTQLLGLKIKKTIPGINWIADFRDPWTSIYYYNNFYPTRLARHIDSKLESKVLLRSDMILTVGEKLKEQFIHKEASIARKTYVVYNGYDEVDFIDYPIQPNAEVLVTYVGTLTDQYPMEGLIESLESYNYTDTSFLKKIRIVGGISNKWRRIFDQKLGQDFQLLPYSHHKDAIDFMSKSKLLLLVIPDHKDNSVIITGKIFEYLRTGIPILCLGPVNGEAAQIIARSKAGITVNYDDQEKINDFINKVLSSDSTYLRPEQFTRKNITQHIAKSLNK